MAPKYRQAHVRFLSEAGCYVCEVPDVVEESRPTMASVVVLTPGVGFGSAARTILYSHGGDPSANEGLVGVADLEKDGILVSVFRVNEPPPYLCAYWRLGDGAYLSTFMPAQDPLNPDTRGAPDLEGLETVIQNLTIGSALGLPVVVLGDPLKHGDLREPEQRDETQLNPPPDAPGGWPVLTFRREPPWAIETGSVNVRGDGQLAEGAWIEAWAVTSHQVRIACQGPAEHAGELREAVEQMRATLRPAPA